MVGHGNAPVHDAGWPEGALAVANLKSRVGWWEGPPFGGGEWHFLYRGDTTSFTQALASFAAIRAPVLELVVQDGPEESTFLKDDKKPEVSTRVDWEFTVWVPGNWHRLFNNPKSVSDADHPNFRQPVAPPRLNVYVGAGGGVDWNRVTVPSSLRVRDERAAAAGVKLEGGATLRADVYDMATGKPVREAHVTLDRAGSGRDKARPTPEIIAESGGNDTGSVVIEKIPAGTYRVWFSAEGYAPRVVGHERFRERSLKQYQVELTAPADLIGVVTDTDGQPLEGVEIRASNTMGVDGRGYNLPDSVKAVTDKAGRFALAGLPRGYAQVRASAPDFYDGDIFTIHDVPSTNVVLRLSRAGRIHVTVTDKNGRPLGRLNGASVLVEVEPMEGSAVGKWGGSATVKDDGTYDFEKVPPGEYRVTSHPNPSTTGKRYAPERIITLDPGGQVEVKVVYD